VSQVSERLKQPATGAAPTLKPHHSLLAIPNIAELLFLLIASSVPTFSCAGKFTATKL
jgi:hypothetical protein